MNESHGSNFTAHSPCDFPYQKVVGSYLGLEYGTDNDETQQSRKSFAHHDDLSTYNNINLN